MANTTSDHIKPCNIGQSEAHNRRTKEYLARINKDKIYVRLDLMERNESWIAQEMDGMDLQAYHDAIAQLVKEKTGRAMQTKERTRTDKKTGKTVKVNGSSPIRESVVVCKAGTTMEDLKTYCDRCHERWGITAIQIHIHRDEGHYQKPGDAQSWAPNYHAHIVWDWMNHETGKSCKLGREDMSCMQDMVAEALNMERGKSKKETGKEHLDRNDYIVAKQKQEAHQALITKAEAETEQKRIEAANWDKERRGIELDKEIEEKASRANKENGNAILFGLANLAGYGKYARIAKENKWLKASLTEAERKHADKYNALVDMHNAQLSERQKAEKELADYKRGEADRIDKAVTEKTEEMQGQIRELKANAERKNELLSCLAAIFIRFDELFRKAVKSIIHFAQSGFGRKHGGSGHQDFFTNEEALVIKSTMIRIAGENGNHRAVGDWLVQVAVTAEGLDGDEIRRAQKEVDSVASGEYDWRIERTDNGLKR